MSVNRAMFYAQFTLQWDFIEDARALRNWRALKRQYQLKRPITKRIGEELYSMAKENGYDTLEKQKNNSLTRLLISIQSKATKSKISYLPENKSKKFKCTS